ncbi:MAG: DUF1553 domain-containing protein, partial [Planctomycetales bacterium]|nr:DUF1553 domain-containing protein [Planctomycetales bacterium]
SRLAVAMWDGSGEDEHLLIRGNPATPGDAVPRHALSALGGHAPADETGSGRLQLARDVLDPKNPLTARVMANRVWHHLTGRGIVRSCDNFGVLGDEPTHPELLDHLATQLVREGWSVKRLIRAIVLSRTYQMSSHPSDAGDKADPGDLLLHRMRIRRLEAEAIRDNILTVSGRLDRTLYGPSVPVHLTEFMTGRGRPGQSGPLDGAGRRSIYTSIRRNFLSPMMLAFDMPQPSAPVGKRTVSNVPAQALILMNDPFVLAEAQRFARRLLDAGDLSLQARVEKMYLIALCRAPTAAETEQAIEFLHAQGERYGLPEAARETSPETWTDLCHVMFNVKEFIFVN